jgi:hypothetical protein
MMPAIPLVRPQTRGGGTTLRAVKGQTETGPLRSRDEENRVSTQLVGRWPAHAQREQASPVATAPVAPAAPPARDEALEFVRFCYRRRHVGWPELYDEMAAVAARGSFRGLGYAELADCGISFCLGDLSKLAALTEWVVREEEARFESRASGVPMMASRPATS